MILSSINKLMIFIISRRRESGSRRIEDTGSSLRMASKLVREEEVIREWEKRRQKFRFYIRKLATCEVKEVAKRAEIFN